MRIFQSESRETTLTHWHLILTSSIAGTVKPSEPIDLLSDVSLTSLPLRPDLVFIQREKQEAKVHPIAQRFRKYNVIDYKGPSDQLGPVEYYKGVIYLRQYHNRYTPKDYFFDNLSLTLICSQKPSFLFSVLDALKMRVEANSPVPGIFQVYGEQFPIQIVALDLLVDPEIAFPFAPLISEEVRKRHGLFLRLVEESIQYPKEEVWKDLIEYCFMYYIVTESEIKEAMELLRTKEEEAELVKRWVAVIHDSLPGQMIREQGFEEGIVVGMEKGLEKGMEKNRHSMIRTALSNGADVTYLAKIFEIPEGEIAVAKNQM